MNMEMKNLVLAMIISLLLAACGGAETASAPEVADMEIPTHTSSPIEDVPTTVPSNGANSEQFGRYIGLKYPPTPAGFTEVFSMLIQDKVDYSLMMVVEGGNKMLWLSKFTHYDTDGNAYWEVKDVLGLSNLGAGLTLLPDGCLLNGTPDHEIITVVGNGMIVLAWRVNTALDRFETMATNGIQCNSDKAVRLD
jgi:hypothetical protein